MSTIKCSRCQRRYHGRGDWNVIYDRGVIAGYVCPSCQTADENAEAVINEATIDYTRSHLDGAGRRWAPQKGAEQ